MPLLDELLKSLTGAQTPWAQQQMAQMLGPGAPSTVVPDGASNADTASFGLPVNAPQETRMTLGGPSPAPARTPSLSSSEPSFGTFLAGALRGAAQADNPISMLLGGIGGALGAGEQVDKRNQLFSTLVANGIPQQQAALFIQSPEAYKMLAGGGQQQTDDIREYNFAKRQGFDGSYMDFQSKMAEIKRSGKVDPMEVLLKRDELQRTREQTKFDDKRMAEVRTQGDTGRGLVDKLGRLRSARDGVGYEGGIAPTLRTWLGKNLPDGPSWLGIPGIPSQQEAGRAEEVQSLGTEIQLLFTQQTKGAISNREMELFGQATPGMAMSDIGAQSVINGMEAGAIRAREKPKFFEAWRKQNGSLDGADAAWDSFVENSPVIQPDGKGGFTVNKTNAIAWQRFVNPNAAASAAQQAGNQPSAGAPAAASAPVPGARQAPDGNWYVPDPQRPGKYLRVNQNDGNGAQVY